MEETNRNKGMKWLIRIALAITIFAILGVMLFIAGHVYVYKPFNIGDVLTEPVVTCPGREVNVDYSLSINGGPYTVDRIKGEFAWESPDDPRPLGGVVFDRPTGGGEHAWFEFTEDAPTMIVESPVRREAPTFEGDFFAVSTGTIEGRMFGFIPVDQHFDEYSEAIVTVLPRSDEQCKSERGE